MEKVIPGDSWNFGVPTVQRIKYSSRGLLGSDKSVLEKRAGSEFADLASRVKFAANQIPLHVIGLGSFEGYGHNYNGDAFDEPELVDHSDTFRKFGRWYRNHQNKDPDKSYGVIKLAYYNGPMRRTELLVLLNGDEKAAQENGGRVANEEQEMIDAGKDIPTSMACKVAHDVCDACGNKAPSRKEYCKSAEEGGNCTLFGCSTGLTKVSSDGRVQFVRNPRPTFFDISKVGRNADPISWGVVADYLHKTAAANHRRGGAELAEMYRISPPLELALQGVTDQTVAEQLKLAYRLAELEDQLSDTQLVDRRTQACALAFSSAMQPALDLAPLGKVGSEKFATGLNALASQRVLLSPYDFANLFSGGDAVKAAELAASLTGRLPGVFNRLLSAGNLPAALQRNPFRPATKLASVTQRQWAEKCAATHSVAPQRVALRSQLAAIRDIQVSLQKTASEAAGTGEGEQLASAYALYKIAFLQAQETDLALTAEFAVRQNYTTHLD